MITLRYTWLFLSVLILSLVMSSSIASSSKPVQAELASDVNTMLSWLPTDTETVIVAQGTFEIKPFRKREQTDFLEAAQSFPLNLFHGLQKGFLLEKLKEQKVIVALEGSRRVRYPHGASGSLALFEGCEIMRFGEASNSALQAAFDALLKKASKRILLAGQKVAVLEENRYTDVWSSFIAQPEPGLLLLATNQSYLQEMLARMHLKAENRALPEALPEWLHVDIKAPVWAVRHYRQENAAEDPSSPLGQNVIGFVDPEAVGFTFWYSERFATVRYLSKAKNVVQLATHVGYALSEKPSPKIEQVEPGVVEISTEVNNENIYSVWLVLMAYLGHVIFL